MPVLNVETSGGDAVVGSLLAHHTAVHSKLAIVRAAVRAEAEAEAEVAVECQGGVDMSRAEQGTTHLESGGNTTEGGGVICWLDVAATGPLSQSGGAGALPSNLTTTRY